MVLSINIPERAGEVLREVYGEDLSRATIEAIALEGYRTGRLSRHAVQTLLGFDNIWDTENWLGAHQAHVNYSEADLESDHRVLDHVLGNAKPSC